MTDLPGPDGGSDRGRDGMVTGSVLFTDIVGFTEYTDTHGDAAAIAALDVQSDLILEVAHSPAARVVKELGDGAMLWFADAGLALRSAVDLAVGLEEARLARVMPLAVRMGLHHGPATRRGGDFVGHSVNVASRISGLAGPGELLVSGAVLAAAGSTPAGVELEPVGPVPIRGVDEPIWLHRAALPHDHLGNQNLGDGVRTPSGRRHLDSGVCRTDRFSSPTSSRERSTPSEIAWR